MNTISETDTRPLMVSIRCITYNHEPYIRQCLEGFVMQKTNFRFEAIVHDDASTDGTATIIREYAEKYPDIIKPIYETENQYSKHDGSLARIMDEACKGKYIACCEGDDYWTDPQKLQKQVDFMESHSEYGLIYTKVNVYDQKLKKITGKWGGAADSKTLLRALPIPTLSILFRNRIYEKFKRDITEHWLFGDIPLCNYFVNESKIKYLDEITGVYRILSQSASHIEDFEKTMCLMMSVYDCKLYFDKRYHHGNMAKTITQEHFFELCKRCFYFNRAFNTHYWRYLNKYKAWSFKILIMYLLINTYSGRYLLLKRYKMKGIVFKNNR